MPFPFKPGGLLLTYPGLAMETSGREGFLESHYYACVYVETHEKEKIYRQNLFYLNLLQHKDNINFERRVKTIVKRQHKSEMDFGIENIVVFWGTGALNRLFLYVMVTNYIKRNRDILSKV